MSNQTPALETPAAPPLETRPGVPALKTVSAADLAAPLIEAMPEVNEKAVAAITGENAPAAPFATAQTPVKTPAPSASSPDFPPDSLGRKFDAARFRLKDGRPQLDSKGRFVPLNLGKRPNAPVSTPGAQTPVSAPANAAVTPAGSFVAPDPAPPPPPAAPLPAGMTDRYDLTADMYCKAFYGGAVSFLSDEWLPSDKAEHIALRDSVAAYLRHKGMEDLPPGAALGVALLAYGGKRLAMPKTMGRLSAFKEWARLRWAGFKGQRAAAHIKRLPTPQTPETPPKTPAAQTPQTPAQTPEDAAHARLENALRVAQTQAF